MKNFKRVNENYHMFNCSFVSRWFGKTLLIDNDDFEKFNYDLKILNLSRFPFKSVFISYSLL